MTQEEKDRWMCKIRSCQTMVLEGSERPDFLLFLAVDAELITLRAEVARLNTAYQELEMKILQAEQPESHWIEEGKTT